jgi:broad specificity phosphatase PhoE
VTSPARGSHTARLTLICHGMTGAVRSARLPDDEPLEELALEAARAAAPRLRPPDRAWCDGTVRTAQTARALGVDPTVHGALADLDVGRWRGLTLDEVPPAELRVWTTDTTAAPHGGESIEHLLGRVARWMSETATLPGRTTAITHPAVIRAAVVAALNADHTAFWRIDVPPLTTTSLHCRNGRWTLRHASAGI